jgi:anti-sigma regulatory factor (Ser/Thr protein kinase)
MTATERTFRLEPAAISVRHGRHLARELLLEWGLPELVDDVQLGVSELVGNAVRHAQTTVVMTLHYDTSLVVSVRDEVPDLERSEPHRIDGLATGGRGLQIVEAISADWGVVSDADGKSVWFSLDLPSTTSVDADLLTLSSRRSAHDEHAPTASEDDRREQARAAY